MVFCLSYICTVFLYSGVLSAFVLFIFFLYISAAVHTLTILMDTKWKPPAGQNVEQITCFQDLQKIKSSLFFF